MENNPKSDFPQSHSLPDFLAPFRSGPEELIHLRTLIPKKAPVHLVRDYPKQTSSPGPILSIAAYPHLVDGREYLRDLREKNKRRGIFFVVNPGGDADLSIKRFVASFSETDPPEGTEPADFLQAQLSIEPPIAPSTVLITYKSVHRHWLIEGPCTREEWLLLQQGQIAFYKSDATISNESRVMRLPFFNHVRVDYVNDCLLYKPIELHSFNPELRYSVAQLQAAFPVGEEGIKKAFEKLSSPRYKSAGIEPSDELRQEVEKLRKQPRSSTGKSELARDHNLDKITKLREVLDRQDRGESLNQPIIQTWDYRESNLEIADVEYIEAAIKRICFQLANARHGTKADTLFHCGLILYGLVKGGFADDDRITSALLDAVGQAGATDPNFDPGLALRIARDAHNKARPATSEQLRARQRDYVDRADQAPLSKPKQEEQPTKQDGTPDFGPGFFNSFHELDAKETRPAEDLMVGFRRGQSTMIFAVTDSGKSTILENHMLAAAGGQRWDPLLPKAPSRPLKIVYFDNESTEDELKNDVRKMLKTIGNAELAMSNFIPVVQPQVDGEMLNLSNRKHLKHVKNFLLFHQPDIVIFDTVGSLFQLISENDNAEVTRKVVTPMKELASAGNFAIGATHHIGKRGEFSDDEEEAYRGRGASALGAATRNVFTIKKEKLLGPGYIKLTLGKGKGIHFDPVILKLNQSKRTYEICGAPTIDTKTDTAYQQVLGVFNGKPLRRKDVIGLLPTIGERTVEQYLNRAVTLGDLKKTTRGKYEKAVSAIPQSPKGAAEYAETAQMIDTEDDSFDFGENLQNGHCGNSGGSEDLDFNDPELEAIDR